MYQSKIHVLLHIQSSCGYFARLDDQLALLSDHMDFYIGKQFFLA